ncbi:hypothetical protein F5878DRAFT_395203 [Lentinula raphanica]|uniref:Uncharacterized protein n=1 Tax=Lentinula raphanica TaxID=153919 RepID=A0AA38PGE1_9AGAR|nr:hypothetical protein F5878DRAFT_395203 [Lentinula raphanica]
MLLLRSWTSYIPLTRLLSALLFITSCPSIATAADRLRPILPKPEADSLPQIQPDQSRAVQDLPSIGPLMDEVDYVNLRKALSIYLLILSTNQLSVWTTAVVLWVPAEDKSARVTRHAYFTVKDHDIKGDVKGMSEKSIALLTEKEVQSAGTKGPGRKEIGNACFKPCNLDDLFKSLDGIASSVRQNLEKSSKKRPASIDFLRTFLGKLDTSGLLKQPLVDVSLEELLTTKPNHS